MEAVRMATGAYRPSVWHLVEGEGTIALCSTDVAKTKGGRGRYTRILERVSVDTVEGYRLCGRCRAKRDGAGSLKLTTAEMAALLERATKAADAAWMAARPRPMTVYTPRNPVASLLGGDDGGPDPAEPVFYEPEGVCGFAWVTIRPGTSRFARYLKKLGLAKPGWNGGITVWSPGGDPMSQSYARKMAAAEAYAATLREAGIKAYAGGRLD